MKETMKKSILSAWVFFWTLLILSVWYATLVGWLSTSDKVWTGSWLTATSWNSIMDWVLDLDSSVSNFTFNSWNVWIWVSPNVKFQVSWWMTKLEQESWIYPTLGASWLNYWSSFWNLSYRMDSVWNLRMRWLIKSGLMGCMNTIFTLPVWYSPLYNQEFIWPAYTGNANIMVKNNWIVCMESASSNAWVSFDNVSLPLD